MTVLKTLYDEDFATWSKQQAEALRAAARGGSNQLLDWENLAEEIDSLRRPHYTGEQIFGDWFPEEPRGSAG